MNARDHAASRSRKFIVCQEVQCLPHTPNQGRNKTMWQALAQPSVAHPACCKEYVPQLMSWEREDGLPGTEQLGNQHCQHLLNASPSPARNCKAYTPCCHTHSCRDSQDASPILCSVNCTMLLFSEFVWKLITTKRQVRQPTI